MFLELLETPSLTELAGSWPKELTEAMVPDIKVIYSDVDGTLLGPGGCLFMDVKSGYTGIPAQAILACHMHKIDVVLVSGRNRHQLCGDARILGFKNWIAELGCQLIYNMGETVVLNVGDFAIEEGTIWQAINSGGAPHFLLDRYKGELEQHLPWSENRECTHIFRGWIDVDVVNDALRSEGYGRLKIVDNGCVRRRSANLNPDLPEVHAYHLLPRASGKASAVRKDRELRGIPREATIAIGDSVSDLELAPEVGALFLVRNAITESPGILDKMRNYPNVFITHESMGLGWAEVINYLIGRRYV
ncbi:MAG: hypothetical protein IBX64_11020 [Actinobacteria bacterium]|nr:hypothetical protein [Actinomycetota bacterium]